MFRAIIMNNKAEIKEIEIHTSNPKRITSRDTYQDQDKHHHPKEGEKGRKDNIEPVQHTPTELPLWE